MLKTQPPRHYLFAIVANGETVAYQRATTAAMALFFAVPRYNIKAAAKAWRV